MTAPRRATRPHECPHCNCTWPDNHPGAININAPFYPLVALIEAVKAEPNQDTHQ